MQNFAMTGVELMQSPRLISRRTWHKYAELHNIDEALEWYRRERGDRHVGTVAVLVDRARLLQYEGRLEEARASFDEAIGLAREADLDAWRLGLHRVHYGVCLAALGETAAARQELTEAHAALVARFGESDYRTLRAAAALAATR